MIKLENPLIPPPSCRDLVKDILQSWWNIPSDSTHCLSHGGSYKIEVGLAPASVFWVFNVVYESILLWLGAKVLEFSVSGVV